ncbi:MAG TPA: hypothetical protein VLB03_11630, partial [Nocardioidaceae bacterium]|nr:hypothetical protein [Nocardioidaceae bacterium]
GTRALFVGGGIYSLERIGTVLVSGPVAKRYVTEGELRSGLGWPTGTNRAVRDGERVDFEHGYIRWFRSSGKTVVRRNR